MGGGIRLSSACLVASLSSSVFPMATSSSLPLSAIAMAEVAPNSTCGSTAAWLINSFECSTFSSQCTFVGEVVEARGGDMSRIVSRAEDGDMTPPAVPVECGDEPKDVGAILGRFVMRRSSCESWLQAKHLLITGLSRSPLKLPDPWMLLVGEGEEAMCSRGSVAYAL